VELVRFVDIMGVQQQVFFCDEPYFSLVIMSHYA